MKKLLLILLIASSIYADVIKDGNIVIDNDTGLVWEDQEFITEKTWIEAISYCEALDLSGYDDWRLPNKNELSSIVDYSKSYPSIKDGFVNTTIGVYWSSTTDATITRVACVVRFDSGYIVTHLKTKNDGYVRCVRSGQ